MTSARFPLFRAAKWLATAALLVSRAASAQTWPSGTTTPTLRDLVSVDRTGEANWLFGSEDVAGDGLQTFGAEERALDVRSAYAELRGRRLALRAYVSADTAPEQLRVYAFINVDRAAATGGPGSAPEIDTALDGASPDAGYEVVIGMLQEPEMANVWRWQESTARYEPVADLDALELVIEAGADRDPLDIGDPPNGYLQAAFDPRPLDIPETCSVELLFRASDGLDGGDSDVGEGGPCRAEDANRNGVADVAEVEAACDTDDQCPAGGSCVEGICRAPELVLGPGEVVRGGAFACSSTAPQRSAPSAWLGGIAALAFALERRARKRTHRGGVR